LEVRGEMGNLKYCFTYIESGYSLVLNFRDDLIFQYNTTENSLDNKIPEILKDHTFSEICYYYRDLIIDCSNLLKDLPNHEKEINKKSKDDYPVIYSCLFFYLSYLLRFINENNSLNFPIPEEKEDVVSIQIQANIRNLSHLFPQFKMHYPKLVKLKKIEVDDSGNFHWKDDKRLLADYFYNIFPEKGKSMKWQLIESIFKVDLLAQAHSRNGDEFKSDVSPKYNDFMELLKNT
jgi:hypothetical protein